LQGQICLLWQTETAGRHISKNSSASLVFYSRNYYKQNSPAILNAVIQLLNGDRNWPCEQTEAEHTQHCQACLDGPDSWEQSEISETYKQFWKQYQTLIYNNINNQYCTETVSSNDTQWMYVLHLLNGIVANFHNFKPRNTTTETSHPQSIT